MAAFVVLAKSRMTGEDRLLPDATYPTPQHSGAIARTMFGHAETFARDPQSGHFRHSRFNYLVRPVRKFILSYIKGSVHRHLKIEV
ncbi:hypothetical protein P0D72_39305 [Paraburkholderia sediminicola]|uniref:hypothetical protein n=1 Tax=Paraburkholderia sediminicola TaxID=458836 RepID=UPI000BD3F73D|nr:hypothetical protein SAMN05446635_0624 [Burkholderia sp. OK233]